MSTFSPGSVTTITVKYDARDISDIDIQEFKDGLQELGYTRVRGHRGPMAGTGGIVSIAIIFVGLAALNGIIGHIAVGFFNKLAEKILSFIKKPSHSFPPNFSGMKISYDDIDIEIRYIDDNILKDISLIMNDIIDELKNGGLKKFKAGTITMPMEIRDVKWEPFFIEDPSGKYNYPFQFWNVCSRYISDNYGIYDFINKKFI